MPCARRRRGGQRERLRGVRVRPRGRASRAGRGGRSIALYETTCAADAPKTVVIAGESLEESALRAGDLVFWRGHVGAMLTDTDLIHANAHHMAVAYEPARAAIARIEAQGDGPVTSRRRL